MSDLNRCSVVLVDDHAMVRQALAHLLEDSGWIDVVGQAGDRHAAVEAVLKHQPDVLVLDYSIPGGGALPVIEALVGTHRVETRILVLTVHDDMHYAVRVLEAGADGYAIKSAAVQELENAIRSVWQGSIYLAPSLSREVMNHLRTPQRSRQGLSALSVREFELLRSLGNGLSLGEAAKLQNVSVSTASTYRSRLMTKLKLNSTADIIRFAIENELTDAPVTRPS